VPTNNNIRQPRWRKLALPNSDDLRADLRRKVEGREPSPSASPVEHDKVDQPRRWWVEQ